MPATEVIGRDAELARTAAFLDALPSGPSGLVGADGAIWVANAAGSVAQIDPGSNSAVGEPVKVGSRPQDVAFGEGAVWVVNQFDGSLSRVKT